MMPETLLPVGTGVLRMPLWMRRSIPRGGKTASVEKILLDNKLHTVCREAGCPNRAECFGRGTATFLILGDVCSRDCRFCGVAQGKPAAVDADEPRRIAEAAAAMALRYVVITSVTRDDLPDGGAAHFAAVVRAVAAVVPQVEVLIPDFAGNIDALTRVIDSGPCVINHNIETVPCLYPAIRPQADYRRSLDLLKTVAHSAPHIAVKSGLMVGLGEKPDEVCAVLADLAAAGCSIATIGQYLRPSLHQSPVVEYITPEQFDWYREKGGECGLKTVYAGSFVRSSYNAADVLLQTTHQDFSVSR